MDMHTCTNILQYKLIKIVDLFKRCINIFYYKELRNTKIDYNMRIYKKGNCSVKINYSKYYYLPILINVFIHS